MYKFAVLFALLVVTTVSQGEATLPTADVKGSRDHPLLGRYAGSFVVGYDVKRFDEFALPLSPLEFVEGRKDSHNNRFHAPKTFKSLEGERTRLVYLIPAERSPVEVLRNYQEEIKNKGGSLLFECKDKECGGDPGRSSSGGGGDMSLAMFLYPEERITDPYNSNGYCAITGDIANQRFTVAELPAQNAYVAVHTYTLRDDLYCKAFNDRTIAVVEILQTKAREQKMVVVKAEEMAQAIAQRGSVALYGIYFDFNKTDLKPESDPTLEQIGRLLTADPALKVLVVGHTDNVGTFPFNQDLSQRRAEAVSAALVARYGIAKARLTPVGVSFAAPVSSNTTEEGRAKNRRVELVSY
ncbi:MAG TPA: DUF4892 domain-containing protein [Candidatus Competibacter sp.]|nr:flagellar motor protein MotB [Candidatus Competibacteraceae bacterium]HUM94593.1 DUF4892 domain-containing protein [Candidatus Competibacter sp.]